MGRGNEDYDDDDESFRAVSTWDRSYTPQWQGLQRFIIFQGEAETVYS